MEKPGLIESGMISSDPDFTDIDCDHKDPQLCSLYAADIHNSLRVAEVCATYYHSLSIKVFFICSSTSVSFF